MTERIPVYRYAIEGPDGPAETRWSLVPVKAAGYAGNDEPSAAHALANGDAAAGETHPAGHVEAPAGSRIVSLEPPILEIPGRGNLDLSAVIEEGRGAAPELGGAVRWRPLG